MSNRQRFIEINDELRQLSQKRRELLEERRQLSGVTERSTISQIWVDPTFAVIKKHPGISRREIFVKLNDKHLKFEDLTNVLTTLRRRGWIENQGTRKYPKWYAKEVVISEPHSKPDSLDEVFRRSEERLARLRVYGTQEKVVRLDD